MQEIGLNTIFLNNSLANYLIFILFLAFTFLFVKIFDKFLLSKMNLVVKKYSHSFSRLLRDIFKKRLYPILYILAFYLGFSRLNIISQIANFIELSLLILTVIFVVLMILDIISYTLRKYWAKKKRSEEQQKVLSISLFLIKILIWVIALLFILDNLNIQITGLVTGLGVGGVALAFAAQSILTDLFNYFTIFFDKPFDIGDFIITGNYKGTIEHIGIKTTRLRSLSGEQLIISNTDLVNSRINNYKRMERRRINFSFSLTYDTPLEKIKKVPDIVENIIKDTEKAEFDRAHFAQYAEYSLLFEVVYYVEDSDYKVYMDTQEKINFKIGEEFEKLGVNFAYPTQTIHLASKDLSENKEINVEEERKDNEFKRSQNRVN